MFWSTFTVYCGPCDKHKKHQTICYPNFTKHYSLLISNQQPRKLKQNNNYFEKNKRSFCSLWSRFKVIITLPVSMPFNIWTYFGVAELMFLSGAPNNKRRAVQMIDEWLWTSILTSLTVFWHNSQCNQVSPDCFTCFLNLAHSLVTGDKVDLWPVTLRNLKHFLCRERRWQTRNIPQNHFMLFNGMKWEKTNTNGSQSIFYSMTGVYV